MEDRNLNKEIFIVLSGSNEVPNTFQLLPDGKIEIEGEPPVFLDAPAAEACISEFKRRGNDMVIDYEHQTLKDTQAPAAGWVKQLIYRGKEGLWAAVEWTEKARNYLKNREYRYFSPVFMVSAKDRIVRQITCVALTNFPKTNNLRPIVTKMGLENASQMVIDETQRMINKFMGIGDEVFLKYMPKMSEEPQNAEEVQRRINELMGIGDELFCKYLPKMERGEDTGQLTEELQRRINKMLGIDEETFKKYNR